MLPIVAGLAVAAAMLLVMVLRVPASVDAVFVGVVLLVAALATERITVEAGPIEVSGGFLPAVTVCVVAPSLAPLIGLAVAIGEFPSHRSRIANTSVCIIACTVAAFVAGAFELDSFSSIVGSAFAVTTVYLLVNSALLILYAVSTRTATLTGMLAPALPSLVATSMFFAPVVGLLCWGILAGGAWMAPALLIPIGLTQYFHGLYHRKLQLTEELADKAQVLARTNLQFAAAMVRALDTRDAYTAGHSAAVAVYTRDIAREMGFDDETVRLAHLAGLLHDIGKIGVPGRVLNKQSPLDDEEYELMKTHAAMGAEILGEVDLYKDIAILVRYHHERIDGRGYPDKLEGEAIPAISRMISVADTYSAMTTDRPYRDGMPTEKAMSILRECRGTQLDSDFTDAFLRILIVADEAYQRGKQTEFEVEVAKHQALSEVEAEAVRVNVPSPAGPPAPAAPEVPMLPAAVDGELVEVELEREAA